MLLAMSTSAERFFQVLRTRASIVGLKGRAEDADFDCKQWFPVDSAKESLAKAACGFANSTGGVIVIGLRAERGRDGVDTVQEETPVPDVDAVSAWALDAIANGVEPGIEGVRIKTIRIAKGKSGFVILFIPESEGLPHRSKLAKKEFYIRIGSTTLPMPYPVIADRFGRRPQAKVSVSIDASRTRNAFAGVGNFERIISLSITNDGRGLARFPAIRVSQVPELRVPSGFAGNESIWNVSYAAEGWVTFRGSANDVVYPGETLKVGVLMQTGKLTRGTNARGTLSVSNWQFEAVKFATEATCEGVPPHRQEFNIAPITPSSE